MVTLSLKIITGSTSKTNGTWAELKAMFCGKGRWFYPETSCERGKTWQESLYSIRSSAYGEGDDGFVLKRTLEYSDLEAGECSPINWLLCKWCLILRISCVKRECCTCRRVFEDVMCVCLQCILSVYLQGENSQGVVEQLWIRGWGWETATGNGESGSDSGWMEEDKEHSCAQEFYRSSWGKAITAITFESLRTYKPSTVRLEQGFATEKVQRGDLL